MVTFFRLTFSVVLWEGRNTANKYHWHVWGVLPVFQPQWACPSSQHVCFPSLHCSGCRLLCWELSEVGPGLRALPSSKPLRFRFSGTPQRCRLDWACILCPSLVRGAQVTRCLASAVAPSWCRDLLPPLSLPLSFLCVQQEHLLRCAMCLLWGTDLCCYPPGRCPPSRIPRSLG